MTLVPGISACIWVCWYLVKWLQAQVREPLKHVSHHHSLLNVTSGDPTQGFPSLSLTSPLGGPLAGLAQNCIRFSPPRHLKASTQALGLLGILLLDSKDKQRENEKQNNNNNQNQTEQA